MCYFLKLLQAKSAYWIFELLIASISKVMIPPTLYCCLILESLGLISRIRPSIPNPRLYREGKSEASPSFRHIIKSSIMGMNALSLINF